LDKGIVAQDSTTTAARQALRVAETGVGTAEARLATTDKQMTSLRKEVTTAAVRAYVHPGGGGLLSLVRAQSLSEASRRQSLLAHVVQSDATVLERLRGVRQDQESEQANVRRARDLAAQRRREADERLVGLRRVRADQARVKSALDTRIRGVLAEVDSLSREEARLTALIRSRAQAASGGPTKVSGAGFSMPASGTITSRFGVRWGRLHAGIDVASAFGTPVKAAKAGRVILAGSNGGYGNCVIIDHGGGFTSLYGHMSKLRVTDGAVVKAGQQIGDMGSTGASTGNHLHFEIRVGGTAQNPQRYL
ncbi:MAG: murein hydrolase activator EnvC family protein, partial [Pseudonocardiaceae bacterium]